MKKLLSVVIAIAMFSACLFASDAKVAGDWSMTMDSPHGKMTGPLKLEQDGAKLTGVYQLEHAGKLPINGKIDGKKITFSLEAPGGQMTITFTGTLDGDKMSGTTEPLAGEWSA